MSLALLAAVALAAAIHLGWLDRTTATFRSFHVAQDRRGPGGRDHRHLPGGFLGRCGVPGSPGSPTRTRSWPRPEQAQKPVIIDFYATWCTPCRELDEITFHHPDVVKLADRDFVMVKVDLTQKGNPVHQRLLSQYAIKGVPTVVFLDGQGKECPTCGWWIICRRSRFSNRMAAVGKK